MSNNEVIFILNGLVETCERGERGFRSAAESVRNSEFRRLFNIFSQQRAQFISELQAEVHRLGGDASKAGSKTGPLHRTWINLKTTAARDEGSVIIECQREEEASVNDYQEALKADL